MAEKKGNELQAVACGSILFVKWMLIGVRFIKKESKIEQI